MCLLECRINFVFTDCVLQTYLNPEQLIPLMIVVTVIYKPNFKVNQIRTSELKFRRAVHQGFVISPLLFNIYRDGIFNEVLHILAA